MSKGSLSSDFSPLIYGLSGPTSLYPHRFVEHVVRLTSDPTVGADLRRTVCCCCCASDVFKMFLTY
jgi:hypothetical protein